MCHAHAMHVPCTCFACAMHMLGICHAHAMHMMHVPCTCYGWESPQCGRLPPNTPTGELWMHGIASCAHGMASCAARVGASRVPPSRLIGRGAGNEETDCRARRRRGREVAAGRRRDAGTSRLSRPRATFGCTGWRRARTGWRRAFGRADGVVVCGPARAGPTKHMLCI